MFGLSWTSTVLILIWSGLCYGFWKWCLETWLDFEVWKHLGPVLGELVPTVLTLILAFFFVPGIGIAGLRLIIEVFG